ncbi:hypothetical protein HUW86_11450 [Fusobacterium sp. SB021]|uniref:hypothetical protein n=1 Tax=Fusobacterium sp. SB021 TaxID=2744227 RepID=UPI003CE9756C
MRKTALLLTALGIISGVAYAEQPELKVKSVGQYIEIDNTSGAEDIGEKVHFGNKVSLSYGKDWSFGLMARKAWKTDTDDGIHSTGHRIDLDAWKKMGDNFSIGARWRQEKSYDRYYLRTKYSYGMFSGDFDIAYQSNNSEAGRKSGDRDGYYFEGTPVSVKLGPATVGYYFKTETPIAAGSDFNGAGIDHWYRHQLRVGMPVYQGEKLNIGVQYGWEFANDIEVSGDKTDNKFTLKHDNNSHILWLTASYQVTENLTVTGSYEYDMFKWEKEGNGSSYVSNGSNKTTNGSLDSDKYYGELQIGWTYKF